MPIITAYFFTDETEQIGGGPYLTIEDAAAASALYGYWLAYHLPEDAMAKMMEIELRAQDLREALRRHLLDAS